MRNDAAPPFDHDLGRELKGRYVLVGITHVDHAGKCTSQTQFHGTVTHVDEAHGIRLVLRGDREGELYTLPPDTRGFQKAGKGEYRLRGTGELVLDPDYTSTWTIYGRAPTN